MMIFTFGNIGDANERVVNALLWSVLMTPLLGLLPRKLLNLRVREYAFSAFFIFFAVATAATWWVTDLFQALEWRQDGSFVLKFPNPRSRHIQIRANELIDVKWGEIGRKPQPPLCYMELRTASRQYESQSDSCLAVRATVQALKVLARNDSR